MILALRPLQNDPDQENQAANNPKEDLGILAPFPIFHFPFAFSPISTASRASLSALRRLWFAWNSGSAWLSDIVCLDESGWRARRSSSSATCCSADRFGLIICFFPSAPQLYKPVDGFPIGDRSALSPAGVSLTAARCFSPRLSIQP